MTRKPKDESIGLFVETSMKKELEAIALKRDCSVSQVIREAVRQYLAQVRQQAA